MAISKSEFARRRNVSPGRVTQWISAGQISGAALIGEGRGALIDEALAVDQLRRTRDVDQAHSGNGLGTRLELDAPPPEGEAPPAPLRVSDRVEDKIAVARLEGLERTNRRAAIEEAEQRGELVGAGRARQ